MAYADVDDVRARLPGRTIGTTSKPATADVEEWLSDAEAQLDAALNAAGLVTPLTDSRAIQIAKIWIVDYAEGRHRASLAAAGGDGTNRDGQDLINKFESMVGPDGKIISDPDSYSVYLTGGLAAESGSRLRSYASRNTTDRTVDPVFTRDEKF